MTTAQIPETISSSVFGMGSVIEVFPIKKANRWGNIVGMIVFLGCAGLAFLFAVYNTFTRWQKFGPAVIVDSLVPPLIVAAVLGAIGLLIAWSAYSNSKRIAIVYDDGVVFQDRKGLRIWRWNEIRSLTSAVTKHYTNGIYTGTTHVYTVLKKDGQKFSVNDVITNVEKFAQHVREKTFPLLYQEHVDAYNNGKVLTFGPVTLSKENGIQMGKKNYPWGMVSEIGIRKGVLSVKKKDGGWFSGASATASSIPNLEILLAIIDQVLGLKTG